MRPTSVIASRESGVAIPKIIRPLERGVDDDPLAAKRLSHGVQFVPVAPSPAAFSETGQPLDDRHFFRFSASSCSRLFIAYGGFVRARLSAKRRASASSVAMSSGQP
jgi:hypothetical protein